MEVSRETHSNHLLGNNFVVALIVLLILQQFYWRNQIVLLKMLKKIRLSLLQMYLFQIIEIPITQIKTNLLWMFLHEMHFPHRSQAKPVVPFVDLYTLIKIPLISKTHKTIIILIAKAVSVMVILQQQRRWSQEAKNHFSQQIRRREH